jgi:hypothetical protein
MARLGGAKPPCARAAMALAKSYLDVSAEVPG